MEKKNYFSPEFRFQELFLFEGVADPCWSEKKATVFVYYDRDNDKVFDDGETEIFKNSYSTDDDDAHDNGCNTVHDLITASFGSLKEALEKYGLGGKYNQIITTIDNRPNAKSTELKFPIHS